MAFTACTVRVDELPDMIEGGLAVIVTVGAGFAVTVIIAVADAFPSGPIATAVYVVVADGVTACVPPLACSVYEVPSVPVTVTCVALVAVTVRIDELPEVIEVGFAVMLTVGAWFAAEDTATVAVADALPPLPLAVAI